MIHTHIIMVSRSSRIKIYKVCSMFGLYSISEFWSSLTFFPFISFLSCHRSFLSMHDIVVSEKDSFFFIVKRLNRLLVDTNTVDQKTSALFLSFSE